MPLQISCRCSVSRAKPLYQGQQKHLPGEFRKDNRILVDFVFKTSAPLSDTEQDYLVSLDCSYKDSSEEYRIIISDDIDQRADLKKIERFLTENFLENHENLIRHKLCEKYLLATATVPYAEYMTRRICMTAEFMGLLSRYEINFDYEVVPSYNDEENS